MRGKWWSAVGLVAMVACGGSGGTGPDAPSVVVPGVSPDLLFCVDEANRYRAIAGAAPLVRSEALELYAAQAARVDGTAREGHRHFRLTGGGGGLVFAENEIPWWPLSTYRTVREVIRVGFAFFWEERPSGGHYRNLVGPYREIGCGVFQQDGLVTVVVAFR
ncbi:MAG TPA: CAP domain-containing protein [Vicinamibacterales bacterium]